MTTRTPPRIGRIARLKLTEPLRLYVWPTLLPLLALAVALATAGEWLHAATAVATLLAIAGALEAARISVYSPAGVVAAIRDFAAQR